MIEQKIFGNRLFDEQALTGYGFVKDGDSYVYNCISAWQSKSTCHMTIKDQ